MKQTKQHSPVSHTIQSKTKAASQASVQQILQRYKTKTAQREALPDEDELLQGKFETVQRMDFDEDEEVTLQGKFETAQRETIDEEEPIQQKPANKTGLPDKLKTGVENLSGYSMDNVRVHYNSAKPAQLQALAYTQGTDIHVAPGQEKHLPHEAWHVVQQMQGRVQPTMQLQGINVNDNQGLEKEADVMGLKSKHTVKQLTIAMPLKNKNVKTKETIQCLVGFEAEFCVPTMFAPGNNTQQDRVNRFLSGGVPYGADIGQNANFRLTADHNNLQTLHHNIRNNYPPVVPGLLNTMSNLEYVTDPVDELAANSTTLLHTKIDAIAAHARGMFPNVKNQMLALAPPANNFYTGIPVEDLQNTLGVNYDAIKNSVKAYQAGIKDEFYLQATVGIIPSALSDLHKSRTSTFFASNIQQDMEDKVHSGVKNLLSSQEFKTNNYIINLKNTNEINYQALVGLLYTIFSYMVGSALNQTNWLEGSSTKNSVMFMSKLDNLSNIIGLAIPNLIIPIPAPLIQVITNSFNTNQATTLNYWINNSDWDLDISPEREATINPINFVRNILSGIPVAVTAASPRNYANADQLPDEVRNVSANQGGVQMEYRFISARPNANGLRNELMKIVKEVRNLNTKHMGFFDKRRLINAADQ